MLHLFTFLVEKLSLLSYFNLFESKRCGGDGDAEEKRTKERTIRTSAPGTAHGGGGEEPRTGCGMQRGDLLEVPRTLFTHFGIYLGDSRVAHLIPDILPAITGDQRLVASAITNARLIVGCVCKCATVRVDTLEDFAYGAGVLVNRMDELVRGGGGGGPLLLPNEEVAKRAETLIGDVPYSLMWNNCEHFVTHCRYGSAASRQTEKFCECLKSIIRDQRSAIVAVLLGIISICCFGMLPSTTLPTILIPFTLWMAG